MKKSKLTFDQKVLNYSLTAGLVLTSQVNLHASVVATSSGHGLPSTLNAIGTSYNVDFDNDGDPEIRIIWVNAGGGAHHWWMVQNNGNAPNQSAVYIGNAVGGGGWYASARPQASSIPVNPAPKSWGQGNFRYGGFSSATLAYNAAGPWHSQTDKYLGVKFTLSSDSQTHYGWVRMSSTDNSGNVVSMTTSMYAYETVANTPISGPLPVELTTFTATNLQNGIKVNWATATEINNYGFEVERASSVTIPSQRNWEKIGFVKGAGNSSSEKLYSFVDDKPLKGDVYYRLQQLDSDGSFSYSKELLVSPGTPLQFDLGQNYPNPFNPSTSINFTIPESGEVSLKIFNSIGQEVADLVNGSMEAGIYSVDFKASDFPSGIYVYRIQVNGKFTAEKKMNLIK